MSDPPAHVPASLLDEDRSRRWKAVDAIELCEAALFALRTAAVLDEDAEIRARAAERLGSADALAAHPAARAAVEEALEDAIRDPSPAVREAAARSAGRIRAAGSWGSLAERARIDPSFRVRRAALRALADVARERAIPILSEALDDPFWRVRHAAVQVLARGPAVDLGAEGATSPRRLAALRYLAAVRSGELGAEIAPPEPAIVEPDDLARGPLDDDDPAVTTARLAAAPVEAARGEDLVAFLASPHDALRRLAARRLARRNRTAEIRLALAWLDDPRVPYAEAAVTRLLRRVDTLPLVEAVLAPGHAAGPGALAWALDEAARLRHDALLPAARRAMHHSDARVRRAATRALASAGAIEPLIEALDDPDEACRAEAIRGLGASTDPAALAAIAARRWARDGLLVERAHVEVARRAPADADLRAALGSRWADVRARAIAELSRRGSLHAEERRWIMKDPDPWMRAAALDAEAAPLRLESDPDPTVRRAAVAAILRAPSADRHASARVAARSDDPWIRARAADLLDADDDADLPTLLLLTRDRTPMVRAAAADALDHAARLPARAARLLDRGADLPEDVRLAAHAQLLRAPDEQSLAALVRDLDAGDLSPPARATLLALPLAYPEPLRARLPASVLASASATASAPAPVPASVFAPAHARPLGRTGLVVSPLALSGAFELPASCLDEARAAGVNLFFWEPEYRAMTRFVSRAPRRDDLVIVTGSYEADPRSIERDTDRALARLGVDAIGVMLLFWVRSPARLTDEAFATLERLKQRGKIRAMGFSTHLRDLAREAIEARPWDVVMCRLSAAHPGAERALLPAARARGVGVLAFSSLLYGRLLARDVSAADCYRYCLAQPGVSACLSAPRRWQEMTENLDVLRRPALDPGALERLRAHGARVHAENRAFHALVRQPG